MEWISHSATAFFFGQLVVPPEQRPKRAGWWWAIASISPDWLELFTRWFGDIHRGVTHSFYMWPLLALGWVVAARRWGRQSGGQIASLARLWVAFFIVVGSHLLLDGLMAYRIYGWWPFSDFKWAWDVMPLYDVYIFAGWIVLWLAVRRWKLHTYTTARAGLAVFVLAMSLRLAGKWRAHEIAAEALGHLPAAAIRTLPSYYEPWIWYVREGVGSEWKPVDIIEGRIRTGEIKNPWFPPLPGREHTKLPQD